MKKALIAIVVIAVLALVAGYFFASSSGTPGTSNPPTSLPNASSTTGTNGGSAYAPGITISAYDGTPVNTKDFLNNGETVADIENPGSHVLAGKVGYCLANGDCPQGASTTDFSVSYNQNTHFFNIVLFAEPLGVVRKEAEDFLRSRLGVSNANLCSLNYFVGTPYWVNENYDDRNLGFSFCDNAVALPN